MSDDLKRQLFQAQAAERNARRAVLQKDITISELQERLAHSHRVNAGLNRLIAQLEIQLLDRADVEAQKST